MERDDESLVILTTQKRRHVDLQRVSFLFAQMAGVCENRTHPRGYKPLAPVLKTGGPTRTHLPPNWNLTHYTELFR